MCYTYEQGSFKKGLSTLPKAIEAKLGPEAVKLQWKLTKLERQTEAASGFVATFDTPNGVQVVHAKTVVSTAPAHALRHVLEPVLPNGAAALFDKQRELIQRNGIYHPPVAAVTVAYPKVRKERNALSWVYVQWSGKRRKSCNGIINGRISRLTRNVLVL